MSAIVANVTASLNRRSTRAAQLRVAADERPFVDPGLKPLVQYRPLGVTPAADRFFRLYISRGSRRAPLGVWRVEAPRSSA
jgi:hypothetical protein